MRLKTKAFFPSAAVAIGLAVFGCESVTLESSPEIVEEKPEVAEVKADNTPNRIITTFHGDSRTQMGFNWYTTDRFEDAKVWVSTEEDLSEPLVFDAEASEVTSRYAERTEDGYFLFMNEEGYYTDEGQKGSEWTNGEEVGQMELVDVTEVSYKAVATKLKPGTTYYYQVGSEAGEKSPVGTFTTSAEGSEPFTFIQYTDTQNAFWNEHARNEAAFGADTLKQALDTADEAAFVLHTGDLVETAEVEDEWVDLFEKSEEHWLQQPLAVAAGNHDDNVLNHGDMPVYGKFNEHINVPVTNDHISGGSYYSFDYNKVHVVVANTNDNQEYGALGQKQLAWMKEDIREARENGAEWIVLAYHKPLFSKSYHSLGDKDVQAVREDFMRLIDDLDVDLALQGHDHVLSRTKPLTFTEENDFNAEVEQAEVVLGDDNVEYYKNPEGTVFVLPNTAGTKAYADYYGRSLDFIHEARSGLEWLNQQQVDYYNNLFAFGGQPQKDSVFADSYDNNRDSAVQSFAVYTVDGNRLEVEMYQVYGELLEEEERVVEKIHEFGIIKD